MDMSSSGSGGRSLPTADAHHTRQLRGPLFKGSEDERPSRVLFNLKCRVSWYVAWFCNFPHHLSPYPAPHPLNPPYLPHAFPRFLPASLCTSSSLPLHPSTHQLSRIPQLELCSYQPPPKLYLGQVSHDHPAWIEGNFPTATHPRFRTSPPPPSNLNSEQISQNQPLRT